MTPLIVALGVGWGALAAVPVLRVGRRGTVARRVGGTTRAPRARLRVGVRAAPWVHRAARVTAAFSGPVVRVARDIRRRRAARMRDAALVRELPVAIDLLGVAVDAGCTPFLAVETAARWSPPGLAAQFAAVRRSCRLGVTFERALDDAARVSPVLAPLADALLASDRLGAPVAPALARLAAEERIAARRRSEAHARRVPVRLLFPLVFLVLPAFVLLTVVPGLASGLQRL